MAINPFVLPQGVAGLQYGLNPQRQQAPQQQPQQRPQMDPRVRNAGLVEALSSPVSVESGGIPEAIAEALAVGLRGRAARRERQTELDTETRTQKIEDDDRAMERRVQEAQIARALAASQGDQPERWSDPFQLDGAHVQREESTNQYRSIVPRPAQPRANQQQSPALPPNFQWDPG
jgi:hypothetical protein